jgi:G3E family GTPase
LAILAIIGGALGSGKTTTIIEIGKKLTRDFKKEVVIVTNDQGEVLVDTKTAEDFGFVAAEVVRGCLCCKFKDFVKSASILLEKVNPDIILAEPVGSCADIPDAVCNPIQKHYKDKFKLAPLIILLDALTVLDYSKRNALLPPFWPAEYLYLMQVQQAEIIALNKIDLVEIEDLDPMLDYIKKLNERARIITFSAKTGEGIEEILETIVGKEHMPYSYPEVDYETYAKAEAELGWYNGSLEISSERKFDAQVFIEDLMLKVSENVSLVHGEIAHLKAHLATDAGFLKASIVMDRREVGLTGGINKPVIKGRMIINARARLDPENLRDATRNALDETIAKHGLKYKNLKEEFFRPSYPKPQYSIRATNEG